MTQNSQDLSQRAEELCRLSSKALHDLNNMMFVISGYTHLLKLQAEEPKMVTQIEAIEKSVLQSRETAAALKNDIIRLFPESRS